MTPPVFANLPSSAFVFPDERLGPSPSRSLHQLRRCRERRLDAPAGLQVTPKSVPVDLKVPNEKMFAEFSVTPVPSPALPGGVTENSANIFSLGTFKSTGTDFGVTCHPAGSIGDGTLPCTAAVDEVISTVIPLSLFRREKQTRCSPDLQDRRSYGQQLVKPHPRSGPPDGKRYRSDSVFPDPQCRASLQSENAGGFSASPINC